MSSVGLQGGPIRIRAGSDTIEIAEDHVDFAFGDGRLAYDCARCGAQCCRGHGYLVRSGAEVLHQIEHRPYVRFFFEKAVGGGLARVRNCPPACFFLNDDGRCDIHVARGYDAKPETCRLFPFNGLKRVGPYLIVTPHTHLCPLEIVSAGAGEFMRELRGALRVPFGLPAASWMVRLAAPVLRTDPARALYGR